MSCNTFQSFLCETSPIQFVRRQDYAATWSTNNRRTKLNTTTKHRKKTLPKASIYETNVAYQYMRNEQKTSLLRNIMRRTGLEHWQVLWRNKVLYIWRDAASVWLTSTVKQKILNSRTASKKAATQRRQTLRGQKAWATKSTNRKIHNASLGAPTSGKVFQKQNVWALIQCFLTLLGLWKKNTERKKNLRHPVVATEKNLRHPVVGTEKIAPPSGEPTAICFKIQWHFESVSFWKMYFLAASRLGSTDPASRFRRHSSHLARLAR